MSSYIVGINKQAMHENTFIKIMTKAKMLKGGLKQLYELI